ncbi:hypothetical protein FRB99_000628, partial [Tulasnella sp. 403]
MPVIPAPILPPDSDSVDGTNSSQADTSATPPHDLYPLPSNSVDLPSLSRSGDLEDTAHHAPLAVTCKCGTWADNPDGPGYLSKDMECNAVAPHKIY